MCWPKASLTFGDIQLIDDIAINIIRVVVFSVEAEPHHRMPDGPVPVRMDVEAPEQGLVALEQFPQGIDQKALVEPPRPRQEVEVSRVEQPPDMGGLVNVVTILFPDSPEGLDADGKLAAGH